MAVVFDSSTEVLEAGGEEEGQEVAVGVDYVVDNLIGAGAQSFSENDATYTTMRPPGAPIDKIVLDGYVITFVAANSRVGDVPNCAAFDKHVSDSMQLDSLSSVVGPGVANTGTDGG